MNKEIQRTGSCNLSKSGPLLVLDRKRFDNQGLQDVKLPCNFENYDIDDNGEISVEEFLSVTAGLTKLDPKTLFGHLDTNGGGKIGIDENMIADQDPSLLVSGIFDHCRRLRRCC
uniref:Uncharacterized protein LOC111124281 n=1 Tax=Crassostrea virginica TaxID=6565 RepID=A0A8B8D426_CRAVI|nr:uncharacterized protein LOC111124281 [Crassostrea virginica]